MPQFRLTRCGKLPSRGAVIVSQPGTQRAGS